MVSPFDIGRRVLRAKRKADEVADQVTDLVEKYSPLTRPLGIVPFLPGGKSSKRTTSKPQPLVKTFQFTPTVPDEPFTGSVRFVPQPTKVIPQPTKVIPTMTRREEDQLQNELQQMFDAYPTEGEQELAYLTIRENNQTGEQNQTLENALARLAADRPRQFSNQFSRLNLEPAPKKKRKVSKYQKRFGVELKKLKKLHPRTKIQNLMKRAHRATKRAMK